MAKPTNTVEIPDLTPEQQKAIISAYHRKGGLKGGATMKKRGSQYFKDIGSKGAKARWEKYRALQATKQI